MGGDPTATAGTPWQQSLRPWLGRQEREPPPSLTDDLRRLAPTLVPGHRSRRCETERDVVRIEERSHAGIACALGGEVAVVDEFDERLRVGAAHDLDGAGNRRAADLVARARVVEYEGRTPIGFEVAHLAA